MFWVRTKVYTASCHSPLYFSFILQLETVWPYTAKIPLNWAVFSVSLISLLFLRFVMGFYFVTKVRIICINYVNEVSFWNSQGSLSQLECICTSCFGFSRCHLYLGMSLESWNVLSHDWFLRKQQSPFPVLWLAHCIAMYESRTQIFKSMHHSVLGNFLWDLIGCSGTHAPIQPCALQLLLGSLTLQTCYAFYAKIHIFYQL